jgi:thioredoxin 2
MSDNSVLLRCGKCGTVNRVPADRLADRPKCGRCKSQLDFPTVPVDIASSDFDREVLGWPGVVLVFFWASWCAHCRGMFPIIDDLARRRAGIIKVARVNTEREPVLAQRFDVMSVPRLTLYRGGEKVTDLNGAVQKRQFEEWLAYWTGWR